MIQLIVYSKPHFNCYNIFALSRTDKVTTGRWNFVYGILNFVAPVAEEITQSSDQVKMRSVS